MSQHRPDDTNPMDPFGMMKGLRDTNMDAWSKMMQQFVNTEGYAQATGKMLDAYLTTSAPFRKMMEQAMSQVLSQLNMPTRSDVTGLAARLTNIEMRLDELDARLERVLQTGQAQPSPAPTVDQAIATSAAGDGAQPSHLVDPQGHTLPGGEEQPKEARPVSKSKKK